MKNKDQILMEQAYEQVLILNEKVSLKGALAGAALGLGTMVGSHAADSPSELKHATSQVQHANSLSPQKAYETIIELVHSKQTKLPKNLLQTVVQDKALAARLAHTLTLHQIPLPSEIKAVVGDYDKQLKSSLVGP